MGVKQGFKILLNCCHDCLNSFFEKLVQYFTSFSKHFNSPNFCTHCAREGTLLTHLEKMRTWNHIQRLILGEYVYASDVIIRTSLARLFMLKHKTAFLIYREWWSFYLLMSSAFKKSRAKQHRVAIVNLLWLRIVYLRL